ncbi:ABC transporter ATP-binding protein [bacterium]|nr:ABC transporter ATP-binding protein [candidate division CSSED10-310 bacterium]
MTAYAISAEGIGKRFLIGSRVSQADTLAETLAQSALSQFSRFKLRRPGQKRIGKLHSEEFWALRDISFKVEQGQVLGVIGRNGSGKSTLLKILSRITPPSEGLATITGRVGSLLEIGTGFHAELTGRENIFLSGTILGMKNREINARFEEIVEFSGVEQFIDTPVKRYSSGMYLRLAFAVAAHLRTEILLVDEVLSVGDAGFRKKCIDKMSEIAREGRTVLFVSHNLGAVSRLCTAGLLLESGEISIYGNIAEVIAQYGRMVIARDEDPVSQHGESVEVRHLRIIRQMDVLDPATPLTFAFEMDIRKTYWKLHVQLGICTPEGLNVVLDSFDTDLKPELRVPGRYSFHVHLPVLWLRPTIYTSRIKIIAHPDSGRTERFYSEWVEIPVEGGVRVDSVADRVLVPASQWEITMKGNLDEERLV